MPVVHFYSCCHHFIIVSASVGVVCVNILSNVCARGNIRLCVCGSKILLVLSLLLPPYESVPENACFPPPLEIRFFDTKHSRMLLPFLP